jgi:hypothetical protein
MFRWRAEIDPRIPRKSHYGESSGPHRQEVARLLADPSTGKAQPGTERLLEAINDGRLLVYAEADVARSRSLLDLVTRPRQSLVFSPVTGKLSATPLRADDPVTVIEYNPDPIRGHVSLLVDGANPDAGSELRSEGARALQELARLQRDPYFQFYIRNYPSITGKGLSEEETKELTQELAVNQGLLPEDWFSDPHLREYVEGVGWPFSQTPGSKP